MFNIKEYEELLPSDIISETLYIVTFLNEYEGRKYNRIKTYYADKH